MNLFWWFTIVNGSLMLLAHLYTWMRNPWLALEKICQWYGYVSDNLVFAMVTFYFAVRTGRPITVHELRVVIFGKNDAHKTEIDYSLNVLAFLFWQILIVWIVGF